MLGAGKHARAEEPEIYLSGPAIKPGGCADCELCQVLTPGFFFPLPGMEAQLKTKRASEEAIPTVLLFL